MVLKLSVAFTLLFYVSTSFASDSQSELERKLHEASEHIEEFANYELISNSLYNQIRPRANVTNNELSSDEIDQKVRKYVSAKYAPALIGNYSQLYSKLMSSKKDFSDCDNLNPFNKNKNVLVALCIVQEENSLRVQYMTNGYGQGWSISAIFVFRNEENSLKLVSIELQLKEGAKTYIDDI